MDVRKSSEEKRRVRGLFLSLAPVSIMISPQLLLESAVELEDVICGWNVQRVIEPSSNLHAWGDRYMADLPMGLKPPMRWSPLCGWAGG